MPPRRAATRNQAVKANEAVAPVAPPPVPFAAELHILRTQWKWAAFSQFFFTFSPIFNMDDVTISDVEGDLVRNSSIVLGRIMQRLLIVLSYDRKLTLDTWQTALRKQYWKRDPYANPIGPEPLDAPNSSRLASVVDGLSADNTPAPDSEAAEGEDIMDPEDFEATEKASRMLKAMQRLLTDEQIEELEKQESKDWFDLPMLEKLNCMHLLTEWLFQTPNRVRSTMRSDDENATWRIEPIGYDTKSNAYWLIGADRLWIQRSPPKRPGKSHKRKRPANKKGKAANQSVKRPKLDAKVSTSVKGKAKAEEENPTPSGRGHGRAAKAQANMKLDAQAKQLEEYKRQAGRSGATRSSSRTSTSASASAPRTNGTRVSKRLRGSAEDEWQAIPDEWLKEDGEDEDYEEDGPKAGTRTSSRLRKAGLDSDSDLTELSEDEQEEEHDDIPEEVEPEVSDPEEDEPSLPANFVEWETICVTLHEWEHVAEPWEKATHYTEKNLYKVLTKHIAPVIVAELQEIERNQRLEEAVQHRKRSSRIATKQSAREEALAAAKKREEEEEKFSRAKRAEVRQQKEENTRQQREQAREQRRLEREAQEAREKEEAKLKEEREEREKAQVNVLGTTDSVNGSKSAPRRRAAAHPKPLKSTDWELDCEICHRRGINIDDGTQMVSCNSCGKWQHIPCHDHADAQARRPKRNWNDSSLEFLCRPCHARRNLPVAGSSYPSAQHRHAQPPPAYQNNGAYSNPSRQYQDPKPYAESMRGYAPPPQRMPENRELLPPIGHTAHQQLHPSPKPHPFAHYEPQQRSFISAPYTTAYYAPPPPAPTPHYERTADPYLPPMNGGSGHSQATTYGSSRSPEGHSAYGYAQDPRSGRQPPVQWQSSVEGQPYHQLYQQPATSYRTSSS